MKLKNIFWLLSGDDVNIIAQCDKTTKNRFTAIGLLVAVIFIICFISCFFAFTHLLQNLWFGILIGLFFAGMITNIYLFLLYTLSKSGFPYIPNKTARFISVSIRLIFIAFIGIIVSKPIESLVFSDQLKKDIIIFKSEKLEKYTLRTNNFIDKEIKAYQKLLEGSNDPFYHKLIENKKKKKAILLASMEKLIENSNYYIQSIIILNHKYPISWLITTIIIIMFMIPTYLKIYIDKNSIFYRTKHKIESSLVSYEYEQFKNFYNRIFIKKYELDYKFTEHYSDAPFNTQRKKDEVSLHHEDDLLKSLYE